MSQPVKPLTVCIVSVKTPTGICSVWHTVTPLKTGEAHIISLLMNGVPLYVLDATNKLTEGKANSRKRKSEKCTV